MMKGLWSLPVHLNGASFKGSSLLPRIIINIIIVPVIVWAWRRQPPRSKTAFDGILYGTTLLLGWYVITIIDLFLHETQIKTAYGYILIHLFLTCIKLASNILFLASAHRVVSGQLYECMPMIRKEIRAKVWLLIGEFFIITLTVMALYYAGSFLSYEILWLGIAEPDIVSQVEGRRNKLQAAFFAIQWLLALMVLCGACMMSWFRRIDITEGSDPVTVAATLALWVRTFAELIVETHYHPVPSGTAAARDAIYGLCTIAFLFLLDRTAIDLSITSSREPVKAAMEEDTRHYILRKVDAALSGGGNPPAIRSIIIDIKKTPGPAFSTETQASLSRLPDLDKQRLNRLHQAYLDILMNKYGNLGQSAP